MGNVGQDDGAVRRRSPLNSVALRAVLLAVSAGFVYLLIAGSFRFKFQQTEFAHHVIIADAMLHGQLHVRDEVVQMIGERGRKLATASLEQRERQTGRPMSPRERSSYIDSWVKYRAFQDWTVVEDRLYGYWAPLTPVAMTPFVAVFGIDVSDCLINALFGALNVGLFYWLLRRLDSTGLCRMTESCRVGLTLLLAFGTVNFYLSCAGRVWFAAQEVALSAVLAAMIAACSAANSPGRYLLSGVFFGAAILGRNVVGLLGLFFLVLIWLRSREIMERRIQWFARTALLFCMPLLAAVGVQGAYNYARFGNVLDGGLGIQIRTQGDPRFRADYQEHGLFSLHFLPRNLKHYLWNVDFVRLPDETYTPRDMMRDVWSLDLSRLSDGRLWFDRNGNSMFLITPLLVYALLAWRRKTLFTLALACGAVPLLAALLLYLATGFVQFGNRYLLEMLPLLLLLAASGMKGRLNHFSYILIILAVAVNLFGTYRFCQSFFVRIQPWINVFVLPGFVATAILLRIVAVWIGARRT